MYKLSTQAIESLQEQLEDQEKLPVLIRQYKKVIAGKIYDQIKDHLKISEPEYLEPKVLPFVRIEDWSFNAVENQYRDYRESIQPTNAIPKCVFRGFEKACHFEYKFDSKTEKDFAFILENDDEVQKWMRPAPSQFHIYWDQNSKRYRPDFVVETDQAIYIAETKRKDELNNHEVQEKKKAALKYCKHATDYTLQNGGKPWKYLLIPDNEVSYSTSFDYLANHFVYEPG